MHDDRTTTAGAGTDPAIFALADILDRTVTRAGIAAALGVPVLLALKFGGVL